MPALLLWLFIINHPRVLRQVRTVAYTIRQHCQVNRLKSWRLNLTTATDCCILPLSRQIVERPTYVGISGNAVKQCLKHQTTGSRSRSALITSCYFPLIKFRTSDQLTVVTRPPYCSYNATTDRQGHLRLQALSSRSHGKPALRVSAPNVWNSLPGNLRSSDTVL